MAASETARLIASLELQTTKFDAGFSKVSSGMDRLDKRFAKSTSFWKSSVSTAFGFGLERAVSAGVRGVFGALQGGVDALQKQGVVVAQTNAAIKSTGGAAHVSAAQIRDLSEALETKTAIDDKEIQAGANLLLTFTNIRNEAGKGNDIFTQSTAILLDMSKALGTDATASAIQLGKALNDPVRGITALRRVGVAFDATQEKQIKQFVKEGKVIDAQRLILAELNKEFGGSGAAFAATDAGKAAKFADAVEDIQKSFATALLPAITRVRETLTAFLSDPSTVGQAEKLGEAIASIFSADNIKTAASVMTTAANAIGTVVKLFGSLPPEIQALAVGALAIKKITGIGPIDIAKGAGGLLNIVFKKGESPANPLFVADVSGGAGAAGALGKGGGAALLLKGIIPAALIIEGALVIGDAIVDALGGKVGGTKDEGTGRIVGEIAGVKVVLGQNQAVLVRQADAEKKRLADLVHTTDDRGREAREALVKLVQSTDDRGRDQHGLLTGLTVGLNLLQQQTHEDLKAAIAALNSDNIPIIDALNSVVAAIKGGAGGATETGNLVKDLKARRDAALKAGRKDIAASLTEAINKIEPFAKGRQWQAEQIAAARKIADSNKSTADKVAALKSIEDSLLAHQRTMAAGIVGGLENVVKAIQDKEFKVATVYSGNTSPVLPKPKPAGPTLLPGDSRGEGRGSTIKVTVNNSIKDTVAATILRGRIGPTPAEAGSA